jgi:hypothetical protein
VSLNQWICLAVLTGVVVLTDGRRADAQVFVAPAPVVSYYVPAPAIAVAPPVAYYTAPAVSYYAAPAISYYAAPVVAAPAAPVVSSVPATVSFYTPIATPYPVTIGRGLFGRTIIRTPFSTTRY